MNPQTVLLLQAIVRRESLSLLTYVGDAFPWTNGRGTEANAKLREVVAAHKEAVAALGRFLTRMRQPVGFVGSYPSRFTTLNFLSLDHVLTKLVEDERRNTAALQEDLALVADADARAALEAMLSAKKKQLESLESLSAARAQPAAS